MNKIQIKKGDLEILIEGDTKFVEKHLVAFQKDFFGGASVGTRKSAFKKEVAGQKAQLDEDGEGLLSLYQEKKPSTHYDKIALFGYYLKETGKETFTSSDLKSCYQELRKVTKVPGNLEVTIADTIKYTGYVKRSGKKSLVLTSTGMNYVIHQLPATTK